MTPPVAEGSIKQIIEALLARLPLIVCVWKINQELIQWRRGQGEKPRIWFTGTILRFKQRSNVDHIQMCESGLIRFGWKAPGTSKDTRPLPSRQRRHHCQIWCIVPCHGSTWDAKNRIEQVHNTLAWYIRRNLKLVHPTWSDNTENCTHIDYVALIQMKSIFFSQYCDFFVIPFHLNDYTLSTK